MITYKDCLARYGEPTPDAKYLVLWDVPSRIEVGVIPNRLYCNYEFIPFLEHAFANLVDRGLADRLRTFDGCFNIRKQRGKSVPSLHSWGLAIDFDAFENALGAVPKMRPEVVSCFTDAKLTWGGLWKRPDGMHFLPEMLPWKY